MSMSSVLFALPGNETLARSLADGLAVGLGELACRRFPDGESYVRLTTPVGDRPVILVCSLDRPDEKFLPLLYAAAAARDLGAVRVGLVCPYLAYMRQDRRFRPGEAITSAYFARALSPWLDWLVTVDPHLHRRKSLAEIYSIPARVLHAGPSLAAWIRDRVDNPLLIGPDSESEQWVAGVARCVGAPHLVLEKTRHGDRQVELRLPDLAPWAGHTPVLVDDIVPTAQTMIETVRALAASGLGAPVCIGVHGLFAGDAYRALRNAGPRAIVTCNSVPHSSNAIDLAPLIVEVLGKDSLIEIR